MAEGWLRHLAGDRFEVRSAGVDPGTLNPLAVRAMDEVGIHISDHQAEGIKAYLGRVALAHLIVVCDKAAQTCPRVWPGHPVRHYWPFEDPAAVDGSEEEKMQVFRRVRDEIRQQIESWLKAMETREAADSA
jgi:arsenate reductase